MSNEINIQRIARLARLHLTEEEVRYYEGQVRQILSFVDKLTQFKGLEGVEPTSHPLPLANVFREDKVIPSLDVEAFLKTSPGHRGRFFEVPKIIEDKS